MEKRIKARKLKKVVKPLPQKNTPIKVGSRIREVRRHAGLSIKDLAEKLSVSYITIQRIETDKTSPSVTLLSEIAQHLNRPIISFLLDSEKTLFHIKKADQPILETGNLNLRVLAPKGLISEDINITAGKIKRGQIVPTHTTGGFEVAYIICGSVIFRHGDETYFLNEGDFLYYDGQVPHSVEALEDHDFLGIHFAK